ncbi:type I DNA topoisomerase, partial [bacterium]|nr:type I DNA topoisomerase [bacterium]
KIKQYKTKSKLAQEAHEAIRPTSCFQEPQKIKSYLNKDQYKLYNLIWQRAISSQMKPAVLETTSINIKAKKYKFKTTGILIKFDGWLKIYPEKQKENILPQLKVKQKLKLIEVEANQHFTEPPARYNDSSLVKILESLGIGRPSTYAPIISTLQQRNYIQKEKKSFKPTEIGILVNDLMNKHFPKIVDYNFTAKMENELDEIAQGKQNWQEMIKNFYFPFKKNLEKKEKEIAKTFVEKKTNEKCPLCGKPLVIKMSRYGKFLACSGFPKCHFTKPLSENKLKNSTGIKCPKCKKGEVVIRKTKKGRIFYGCSRYPECDFVSWEKPEEK